MGVQLRHSEEFWIALIALLSALLLAASETTVGGLAALLGHYVYWLIRVSIESMLFIAVLYAIEKIASPSMARLPLYLLAIVLSLIPFTLAITSFDLILGLPELGLGENGITHTPHIREFGLELIYLLDNHVVLCALLLLPRLLLLQVKPELASHRCDTQVLPLFLHNIQPPLRGDIYHIEAQEHYIRVATVEEKRMLLHRFSDAIREMPDDLGMQVHRSHWVAYKAVVGILKQGQSLKLTLSDDTAIPVSRSFRTQVEEQFSAIDTVSG